jgi:branched-chain amino acid transport system substrate-binding protein
VVATICHCSGPPSSAALPIVGGSQMWVKHINQNGGLNGHPVRQIIYDDGTDPGRHRAQQQEAVEREHAIAFFAEVAPVTGQSGVEYVNSKRIPVVGTSLAEAWVYQSPMYFPQGSADRAAAFGSLAGAAQHLLPAGKSRLALMPCAEAEACRATTRAWSQFAGGLGFKVVYESQVSIAQPDFTAVCLAARNADAEVMAAVVDQNSLHRLAASCARQGYFPAFTNVPGAVADDFKDDANITAYAFGSDVFPYFQAGTPAVDEYRQALKTYGGAKVPPTVGSATGWVAGKLLERGGATLPEPATSEALLRGLWSIKNDDLAGLTAPLTFVEGQPTTPTACWFTIVLENHAWLSPDAFKRHCQDLPSG